MNLTKISVIAKRAINITIALASLYMLFIITKPMLISIADALIPDKNPPNTIYGQLPPLRMLSQEIIADNITYELNTSNGRLPTNIPDRMYVFKYKSPTFLYQAAKKAQDDAQTLGFSQSELVTDLKSSIYVWRKYQTNSVLTIDTVSNALTLATPLDNKASYFSRGLLTVQGAAEYAKQIFTSIDRIYPTYQTEVKLGRYYGNKIVETETPSAAEVARVDFFRSVGDYKVLGPDARKGMLRMILRAPSRANDTMNHPEIYAFAYEIDQTPDATYPIIPVTQAWDAVKQGKGYISNVNPKSLSPFEDYTPISMNKILINNIYLAYYEDNEPQDYLQPIYVFEGNYLGQFTANNGDITIYYPAVEAKWIKPVEASPQE